MHRSLLSLSGIGALQGPFELILTKLILVPIVLFIYHL